MITIIPLLLQKKLKELNSLFSQQFGKNLCVIVDYMDTSWKLYSQLIAGTYISRTGRHETRQTNVLHFRNHDSFQRITGWN